MTELGPQAIAASLRRAWEIVMKLWVFCTLAAFLFILAGCPNSCRNTANTKNNSILRVGTNANFPPFESIDNTGNLVGFDIDFARALAKKLNLENAEFKEFDFDALILALKQNQIDIILAGLSITKSRQQEIMMIPYQGQSLTQMALLFWGEAPSEITNTAAIKNATDQAGLQVSVQGGHYLENYLRDENISIKPLAGPPEQILDIKYKKSWAAVLDVINAKKFAAQHPQLKLLIIDLPKDKWDLGNGIGIAKTNTELAERIKKAIQELKADGTIEELEKIWLEDKN